MSAKTGTGEYDYLLQRCRGLAPVTTAVAHPCEATALAGAMEAARLGLIQPILVGPGARIREIAQREGVDLGTAAFVDAAHSHDAAAKAVQLVREGRAEILM